MMTKTELRNFLQTMGEPLTDEECDAFFEKLAEEGHGDSEMINLDAVTKMLLPKLQVNLLAQRPDQSTSQIIDTSQDVGAAATD